MAQRKHYYFTYTQETRQVMDAVHSCRWMRDALGRWPDPKDGLVWEWYVKRVMEPVTEE